ncbi:MAG: hypothetical protein M0Z79_00240 [Nitrospiraceae bacterium]|nr:hypothetical protein [Nitrospiraceae bacterium]
MKVRRILSHFNVLNLLLAAVLIFAAARAFAPLFGAAMTKANLPALKKSAAAKPAADVKPIETKSPFPADYMIIAEQNLFHPERKIPVEKKDAAAAPLPKPDFVLYGIIKTGDVRIAYLEDKKQPVSSPARGKKQTALRQGETLSGFTLMEVEANRVVMVRGEERIALSLSDPQHAKTREGAGAPPATAYAPYAPAGQPHAPAAPMPLQPLTQPSVPVSGPGSISQAGPQAAMPTPATPQRTPQPAWGGGGGGLIGGPRYMGP